MHGGEAIIPTTLAFLAGLAFWFFLLRQHPKLPFAPRSLFLILVAVGVICRLAFVFLTPIFYAPDEQAHFNYIKFVSEHGAFPVQTTKLGDAANEWEYFQPPLYYLAMVPIYHVAGALFQSQPAIVFVLRTASVALWALNVWFGCLLLRRLKIEDELLRLFLLVMVCLLPTYTFVSSAINNDNLLATLGGGVLCLLARREQTWRASLLLGVVMGLALLTKQSALIFFPALVLVAALNAFRQKSRWPAIALHLGIVLITALLIYSPWALRNLDVYGTLTPEHLTTTLKNWPSLFHGVASAVHNLIKTFWAVSGISNDVGYPFPLPGMLLLVFSGVGLLLGGKRKQLSEGLSLDMNGPVLTAFLFSILTGAFLVLRFGYLYGMGQGRHLFPLLHAIGLLLALGLRAWPLKNIAVHLTGAWITYAVAFVVFSLCRFP